jgi:undecaprenyl diphosphate synthase
MDGNGRWGIQRGLSRSDGHREGVKNIRRVLNHFAHHGVKFLTLFAFSTENWDRPSSEVNSIIELLGNAIRDQANELHEAGIKVNHLGKLNRLPNKLQNGILETIEKTKNNSNITLSVAYDYGGRDDIINAIKNIIAEEIKPDNITETLLKDFLYTKDIPDPDLIIRTGGEMRLSNFMLWQASYSEFYATNTLWPDFDEKQINKAINEYAQRQRKFGKTITER